MNALEARYQRALKRIGGAAELLSLPEPVKKKLRETTDLLAKTKMLEAIADALSAERRTI